MTLQEANNKLKDILGTRCDELLIDQTTQLDGNAGMLREIQWHYKRHTFWVEYMHFEAPNNQANSILKDIIIPLKLKFKANEEEQWAAFTTIGEFLEWFELWAMGDRL